MGTLKTRIFDLRSGRGYETDEQLAAAMGVSQAYVSKVRNGKAEIGRPFILGAFRAFPGLSFSDLFFVETLEPAVA